MEESMKENGLTITCTEKASTHGKMEEDMRESTNTIKSMVTVSTPGLMEENMMDHGHMVNNMARVNISCQMEQSESDCGIMEREPSGLMKKKEANLAHLISSMPVNQVVWELLLVE